MQPEHPAHLSGDQTQLHGHGVFLTRDVCINACLVKEGQAVSLTGDTLEYQKENCEMEAAAQEVSEELTVCHAAGQSGPPPASSSAR